MVEGVGGGGGGGGGKGGGVEGAGAADWSFIYISVVLLDLLRFYFGGGIESILL